MKLEKRKYKKFATDPNTPVYEEQLQVDKLILERSALGELYPYRSVMPADDVIKRYSEINKELTSLWIIIEEKFKDDSLWDDNYQPLFKDEL